MSERLTEARVYVAAPFRLRALAEEWADRLRNELGVTITSTWHDPDNPVEQAAAEGEGQDGLIAEKDLDEIDISTAMVLMTFPRSDPTTSGRMFEAGYAAGTGRCEPFAVGPVENVFIGLLDENGQRFDTLTDFIAAAKRGEVDLV